MLMKNGDECGSLGQRQTRIQFKCNHLLEKTQIEEVSEPTTCNYHVLLSSPLVCDEPDSDDSSFSMNVYSCLNETLRKEWDQTYTELSNGFITEKVRRIHSHDSVLRFII